VSVRASEGTQSGRGHVPNALQVCINCARDPQQIERCHALAPFHQGMKIAGHMSFPMCTPSARLTQHRVVGGLQRRFFLCAYIQHFNSSESEFSEADKF
jgi:hypothetical protein